MAKPKFVLAGIEFFFDTSSNSCFTLGTVAYEKRKTFKIENKSNCIITKIKVDGCLIRTNANKCDFAFIVEKTQDIIFVELKSEDVNHAYT